MVQANCTVGVLRSLEKCARIGYDFVAEMTRILKRKDFARWQVGEKLPDAALCKAVQEMESGLVDADLGGFLYKKRVARPGAGKSGGKALQFAGKVFLELSVDALSKALRSGVLLEVHCEQDH